jgi:hypothetical protein
MMTNGHDLQVVMAACTLYLHVPFKTGKRLLSDLERTRVEALYESALSALGTRNSLVPLPWSQSDRQKLSTSATEWKIDKDNIVMLEELITRILNEYETDESIRPYVPPGVTMSDFKTMLSVLTVC